MNFLWSSKLGKIFKSPWFPFFLIALVLGGIHVAVRIANAAQNDIWSVGPASDEVRIDSAVDLRASSAAINSLAVTTQAYNITSQVAVTTGTTILPQSSFMTICSTISNANAIALNAQPSISTGGAIPNGMFLVLTSTADNCAMSLQDDNTQAGTSLELAATSRTIRTNSTLSLIYNAITRRWCEVGFASND